MSTRDVMIGLEMHITLPTKSKLFCSCPATHDAEPNTNICPICMGLPGSKPSLNKDALLKAVLIAKALGCKINEQIYFSRKVYFYPDLPKNYQITQFEVPIGYDGCLALFSSNKKIGIRRVHLEEDPASIKYTKSGNVLVDYNRSGIPLVEVVTEPHINSSLQAREFLNLLTANLQYLGILSEKGHLAMKTDVNISIRGYERVEIKNISGIYDIEKAIEYEIKRQLKKIKYGIRIERETLRFDDKRKITIPVRRKEFEEDYGYIFEPDLPVFHTNHEMVKLPELPAEKVERLSKLYNVPLAEVAELVLFSKPLTEFFENIAKELGFSAKIFSFVKNTLPSILRENKAHSDVVFKYYKELKTILSKLARGEITGNVAKNAIAELIKTGKLVEIKSVSKDLSKVRERILEYLNENEKIVEEFEKNPKVINYIIGQIMKEFKGKYSPADIHKIALEVLRKKLR
ncbi:MAG TPA: Asp-tRNA(Asn)/Glu-tRNA(Gln) amidotransferase subunit GatB [Candidatus Aenigmarchaeota archaeon]|nr:Asp-tRNA(Asn)/Glu-tRNA(Gln) amidotransferase subunit GatB [Candidatus Aenigmarchaeota archaeon]